MTALGRADALQDPRFADWFARQQNEPALRAIIEQAVGPQVKVSDADIKAYFDKNHATLDKPEQVRARHILVADEKTADTIEAKLKAGGNFADLAKQYSTDPSTKDKGGELGFFGKGQMVPAFQAAAFSLPVGAISAPVKSPFGWHIINVEEKRQSANQGHAHAAADAAADPGVPPGPAREGDHYGQRRPLQGRVPAAASVRRSRCIGCSSGRRHAGSGSRKDLTTPERTSPRG